MVANGSARRLLRILVLLLLLVPHAAADEDAAEAPSKEAPSKEARANGCTKLGFEGKARFEDIGSLGQFEFDFDLKVANRTENPIVIESANLLLGHEGGWLTPLDPESLDGSYFRAALPIPAGESKDVARQPYRTDTPAMYAVLIAQAEDGHCAEAIPLQRAAFEPPPAFVPPYPYGIGIVEPLHVLPFADGEDSVLFIGQHQALDGTVPEEVHTEISVASDRGGSQPVTWQGFDAEGDLVALWPFARRLPVFKEFKSGSVRLKWTFRVGEKSHEVIKTWNVKRIEPARMRAPVTGSWQLSNGPGSPRFHDHYASPQYRYAYDFVKLDRQGRTHQGNPHRNGSYFAWGKDVRAAADGEIIAFCDDKKDNPGYSRQSRQCALNYIVIKHANELYTAYLHLKNRSRDRALLVGARVKAGAFLARVGNSGESSEPHLHFMAFRVDQTGRIRSVPVTFDNAFYEGVGKGPVQGVPLGGRVYSFRAP